MSTHWETVDGGSPPAPHQYPVGQGLESRGKTAAQAKENAKGQGVNDSSNGRTDFLVRLCGMAGAAIGVAVPMLVMPQLDIHGFWPGLIAVVVGVSVGVVLGQAVGSALFSGPASVQRIPQELSERVKALASDPSRKIEAIKCYREETGASLVEAKDAIEGHIRSLNR